MLTEDYLIRMINLAIAALLRLVGLKREGDWGEAQTVVDITLEQLLGLRASLIKELDDERLYHILTRNGRLDTQRLAIIAQLFWHQGDILTAQGREGESLPMYERALRFFIEACFQDAGEGQDTSALRAQIVTLAASLDPTRLGADTLWPLAGYYEESGNFVHAEGILLIMLGRTELREAILPELIDFYGRLAGKPAAELAQAGMQLDDVREKLFNLRRGAG
jgi:hypothetical protein